MQQEQTYKVRFEEIEVVANSKEEALESALAYLRRVDDSIVKEIGIDLKDPVQEAIERETAEDVTRIVREDVREVIWSVFPQVTDEEDIEEMIDVVERRLEVDWAEQAECIIEVWCDDILEKYTDDEVEQEELRQSLDHLYINKEDEHYSIRYLTKQKEMGTYYSKDNEVIVHRELHAPTLIDLAAEGKEGAKVLTTFINVLNDSDIQIDVEPGIYKEELIAELVKKRSEILEED